MMLTLPRYSVLEDKLNVISHRIGALLAALGTLALLFKAGQSDSITALVSAVIYGSSLIMVFSASAIYHATIETALREQRQRIDHIAILYLIAGTFTPFALLTLQSVRGWGIFGFVWVCAFLGTAIHLSPWRRYHHMTVALNLLMGWSALLLIGPLLAAMQWAGFALLIAGGVVYTSGLFFYLNPSIAFNHFIWHLFVLAGAALHYVTLYFYVF